MTFRVLFLDIDGVLNSEAYLLANPGAFEREGPHAYYKMFDPEACARLQTICEVTDAQIVISSSMRKIHPITDLRLFLEARGVTAPVIDVTPGYAGDPLRVVRLRPFDDVPRARDPGLGRRSPRARLLRRRRRRQRHGWRTPSLRAHVVG